MKKSVLTLILICLTAFVFMSCSDNAGNDLPETEETRFETVINSPETAPVVLELTPAEEEEITSLFNRMIEYDRIYASTDRIMGSGKIEEYNKVADERFDTWGEWTAFVESIYCGDKLEQINKKIENDGIFVNVDGYTYVYATGFYDYLSDDFTLSVEERTADTVTIMLNRIEYIPYNGGTVKERYNVYTLEKTDAGWRISDSLSEYYLYVGVE